MRHGCTLQVCQNAEKVEQYAGKHDPQHPITFNQVTGKK